MNDVDNLIAIRKRLQTRRADLVAELARIDRALGSTILEDVSTVEFEPEPTPAVFMTARQRRVLDLISQSIVEYGFPPTTREIGEAMGIRSTNGVRDHLRALERRGLVEIVALKSRGIRLTDTAKQILAPKAAE